MTLSHGSQGTQRLVVPCRKSERCAEFVSLPVIVAVILAVAPYRATADETFDTIDEVIFTARKREERLIDTPVTVQAVSSETLEKSRVENVNDLYGTIPTLYLSSNLLSPGKDFLNLAIRGIGAQSAGSPGRGYVRRRRLLAGARLRYRLSRS